MKHSVDKIKNGIIRVRLSEFGKFKETLLSKYGFTFDEKIREASNDNIDVKVDGNSVCITGGKKDISFKVYDQKKGNYSDEGYLAEIEIDSDERLFGLGDETRKAIMKRGRVAEMWVSNLKSYGPVPFLLSDKGWGVMINTTYEQRVDLDSKGENKIGIQVFGGTLDLYFFFADSMKETIALYTELTGKPILMPKSAYGLVFVNNEEEGAKDLLNNCFNFRREDIPCDIMGLEPGWMEKHYDGSVDKKWDPTRFYIPYWEPINYSGPWSFFYNLRQMEFGLTLWLCCDYDLLWEEEKTTLQPHPETDPEVLAQLEACGTDAIFDAHFANARLSDKVTKHGEPWFEHLKKFVDQGVAGFKLDGAWQLTEHPDRLWAGKYTDDEVHNVYNLIYARQMQEGYTNYTGKRPLIYSPDIYAGTQHYVATWAGDTGGLANTVGYLLNTSFFGHTNVSCDMDVTTKESMHFGFMLPWTQLLAWRNWHHPWLLGEKLEGEIRDYSKLRNSLFPYIYSMAHKASSTGLTLARALSLVYEDTTRYDECHNIYMFGDAFLVGAFDMHLLLPEGKWYDYFTGDVYDGNCEIDYEIPEGKGGAFFMKENSVIVTQTPKSHIIKKCTDEYQIKIFGRKGHFSFDLIDDDGITFDYLEGKINHTLISVDETNKGFDVTIEKINESYVRENKSTLEIVLLASDKPAKILSDGKEIEFDYDEENKIVSAKLEKSLEDIDGSIKYEFIF